ncbi:neprilysin-11-like isoform X2 [Prorops nasuta]
MNESVKPCDNFYEYMCGQWKVDHPITDGSQLLSWEITMGKRVKSRIQGILEDKSNNTSTKPLEQAKILYKMCMDNDKRNAQGAQPFFNILNKLGDWPIIQSKEEQAIVNTLSWQPYYKKHIEIISNFVFFDLTVLPDLYNATIPRLTVQQLKPLNNDFKFISDVVSYFQENTNKDYVKKHRNEQIVDMINFYNELLNIAKLMGEISMSEGYNLMTISSFQDKYNDNGGTHPNAKIDLLQNLKLATEHTGIKIDETTSIVIENPEFFNKLPALLTKTKPSTIINYMVWSFLFNVISLGDSRLQRISLIDQMKRQGKTKFPTREYICTTQRNLNEAIAYEYIKRYFSENDKKKVTKFTNDLIEIVAQTVSRTDWMSRNVRKLSKEKVEAVARLIAYPNDYSGAFIIEMFKKYELENSLLESVVKLDIFYKKKKISKLLELVKRTEWDVEPTSVNAYFDLSANSLTVTAGILLDPFWGSDRPKVLNFAGIGIAIAHELSHGFDHEGYKFDKNGNWGNWWTPDIVRKYQEKAACFIHQYGRFVVPELSNQNQKRYVNGFLTLAENIADQAAIQMSHAALKKFQSEQGRKDVRLPNLLEFTTEQLYFMYYGHIYCSNIEPGEAFTQTMYDEHPVNSVRVIGSVSNSRAFAKAFKCGPNDPMNPYVKCSIFTN